MTAPPFDPNRDIFLERVVDVPVETVWKAWTRPEHLSQWFTPKPWSIPECEIDLRPGGALRVLMRGPGEGEESLIDGCYIEVVPNRLLAWTDALTAGWRPAAAPFTTAFITFEAAGQGTRYTATVLHKDAETRAKHVEMGFHEGWGAVLDQLADYARTL